LREHWFDPGFGVNKPYERTGRLTDETLDCTVQLYWEDDLGFGLGLSAMDFWLVVAVVIVVVVVVVAVVVVAVGGFNRV
jgi:hypothetical protein